MIEWIKYDREDHPELDKVFIVKHHGGITSGYCDQSDRGRITWFSYTGNSLSGVSHYAEINLPETSERMIDWCEHGNMLICDICAKRHQSTEPPSNEVTAAGEEVYP